MIQTSVVNNASVEQNEFCLASMDMFDVTVADPREGKMGICVQLHGGGGGAAARRQLAGECGQHRQR